MFTRRKPAVTNRPPAAPVTLDPTAVHSAGITIPAWALRSTADEVRDQVAPTASHA